MKKKICVLLAAIMVLAYMSAGCGDSSGSGRQDTVITVWTNNYHEKAFMDAKVKEWNKTVGKEKNIVIDYQVFGDVEGELEQAFLTGDAPDFFPILSDNLERYVTQERVAAIEDMPGGRELVDRFEGFLSINKHIMNGKTYLLPNSSTTYGLIYNKEMFKNAGLVDENGEAKPPETLEELREYARILTRPERREYGIALPGAYSDWFSDDVMKPATASTRCYGYDPVTGLYDYSSLAGMMEAIIGIKEDGSCLPGTEKLDNDQARARFGEGGIGMYFSASYDYSVLTNQFPAKIDWGVAPYPVEDKDSARKQYLAYNRYLAINKESVETKGADKLMEAYRWFYSEELMIDAYMKGINLPTEFSLVENLELDEDMAQWREYAALLEVSAATPMQIPYDTAGQRSPEEIWREDIWDQSAGPEAIRAACEEMSEVMNRGAEKYLEEHPEFDGSQLVIPEWEELSRR